MVKVKKRNYKQKIKEFFYISIVFVIFLYLINLLNKPYFSPFPQYIIFFIFVSFILAIDYLIRIRKEERDEKILGIFVGIISAILILQIAWPVFAPKISLESSEFSYGEIIFEENIEKHYNIGSLEVKIKPPLFPFFNTVEIPLALSNLTHVWYKEVITPPLFSKIEKKTIQKASFDIYADGWQYEELKIKIGYKGDRLVPLRVSVQTPSEYNGFYSYILEDGNKIFSASLYFNNYENFQVCFNNYIFLVDNETYWDLKYEPVRDFSISICDNRTMTGQCVGAYYSVDGKNYSNILKFKDLQQEKLFFKNYINCINANTTGLSKYLILQPIY